MSYFLLHFGLCSSMCFSEMFSLTILYGIVYSSIMWLLARFIYLDALICSLSVFPQLKRKLHECREYFIYNSLFCSKNSALCMVWPIVDTLWRNAQMPFRALTLLLCITENKKDHKDPREGYDTCCFSTIWTWSNLADSYTCTRLFNNYLPIMSLPT